ncbi:MAG: glycosyltransferase family 2 protein [Thermoanaerobaculia bacterium]
MRPATILIPLAGRGSRFVEAGYTEPKPFIPVFGRPMVWWALQTFASVLRDDAARVLFIVHERDRDYEKQLRALHSSARISVITIAADTRGQAESALAARPHVDADAPLYIHNCDTYSELALEEIASSGAQGALAYFPSHDPAFSYLRTDDDGNVVEVAEKRVISDKASNGLYYFHRAADFFDAAREMIDRHEDVRGEYYVMPCYNTLIARGDRITAIPVQRNWVLGTPEDLARFIVDYPWPK